MIRSESIGKLVTALLSAQQAFAPIIREHENPYYKKDGKASKYEDLGAVIDATQPSLITNGLAVVQFPVSEGDRVGVFTILTHNSGEFIGESFTLPIALNNAQMGVGAVTYGRRAGLKAVLGLSAEDDDGNSASGKQVETHTQSVQTQPARKAGRPRKEAYVESTKPAGHGPEPAVIPSLPQAPVSGEPVPLKAGALSAGSLPTEAEKKKFLKQAGDLIEKLQEAGLGEKDGLSAGKRLGRLIKKRAQKDSTEDLTKEDWVSFFKKVDEVVAEGGYARMVQVVEQSEKS